MFFIWGRTWATRGLHTAASDLRAAESTLRCHPAYVGSCCRCGAVKHALCIAVVDASQVYEELPPSRVLPSVRDRIAWAIRAKGAAGIAVKRCSRVVAWLVRHCGRAQGDVQYMGWRELIDAMELGLSQTTMQVGDIFFKQNDGLPIGGMQSSCRGWLCRPLQRPVFDVHRRKGQV